MGLIEWLVPQDHLFFDLFDKHVAVVVEAADLLVEITENGVDLHNKVHKMEELEHRGDGIAHELFERLNRTFITPMEPEEISALASALDDILDYIDDSAHMIYGYEVVPDAAMKEMAKVISLSVKELEHAVKAIRKIKDPTHIEERCIEVNRLENLGDEIHSSAVKELFKGSDPMMAIKLKDIYENMETATDKCEDAANVLSDIAIRHS
jgi:predicted phosphate transport protein (TIGR00153 family)